MNDYEDSITNATLLVVAVVSMFLLGMLFEYVMIDDKTKFRNNPQIGRHLEYNDSLFYLVPVEIPDNEEVAKHMIDK